MNINHLRYEPSPGFDFPRSYYEFSKMFPDDEACWKYLFRMRWPWGVANWPGESCEEGMTSCPKCGSSKEPYLTARRYLHCRNPCCGHEVSALTGTFFFRGGRSLHDKFRAIWIFINNGGQISAKRLQSRIGISYQTALSWHVEFQKIAARYCELFYLSRNTVTPIDVETFMINEVGDGVFGLYKDVKVMIAYNEYMKRKYVYLQTLPFLYPPEPFLYKVSFLKKWKIINVRDSVLDKHINYIPPQNSNMGYSSDDEDEKFDYKVYFKTIEDELKSWLLGMPRGGVPANRLEDYLGEFAFRKNYKYPSPKAGNGHLFYRFMQQALL